MLVSNLEASGKGMVDSGHSSTFMGKTAGFSAAAGTQLSGGRLERLWGVSYIPMTCVF